MSPKLNKMVLVPTNFSKSCDNMIKAAAITAVSLQYKMCLIHLFEKNSGLNGNSVNDKLEAKADEIKLAFNIDVDTISMEGNINRDISNLVDELGANLLYLNHA